MIFAVDIGGTHIKAGLVHDGALVEHTSTNTPRPATPTAIEAAVVQLFAGRSGIEGVAIGFPGVVVDGVAINAPNLDGWDHHPLASRLSAQLGRPVRIANDADVQGFGAIEGTGVELTITLGTGVGSALFLDGRLVPNLELGHAPFRKGSYEHVLGASGRERLGPVAWEDALFVALEQWRNLFNPRRIFLGGGHAQVVERDLPPYVTRVSNTTALTGAARLW